MDPISRLTPTRRRETPDAHPPSRRTPRPGRPVTVLVALVVAIQLLLVPVSLPTGSPAVVRAAANDTVKILGTRAQSLDPAGQGDSDSAAVTSQLFESLTAIDGTLQTRPALAESWEFRDGGATVVFHLRPGLTFSDGSPLTPDDVVRSWRRLIDPAHPSPLVSLIGDVDGALAYAHGQSTDPASVGLSASGNDVTVHLTRPATDFPAIVASPTFGIVPPGIDNASGLQPGPQFVGSGGYVLTSDDPTTTTLTANSHYWAGLPAVKTVQLVHDIGGRSSVAAFEAGDLDAAGVASFDAPWLAWDPTLGPQLRRSDALSLSYYGFDTSRPPFNDVRVRQAFARAVDWRRLESLTATASSRPATGMVPPGIPGRSDADFLPAHDLDGARALLAAAGYPGGRGFPMTVLLGGGAEDRAFAAEIQRELGVTIDVEVQGDGFFDRLA
ncbi:MAG TPA: ABC transporter substrate-binding protein, partial [Candidatus Limnocylindrales bacterium]